LKLCKDCYPTPEERAVIKATGYSFRDGKKVRPRVANEEGPRCRTHWREETLRRKAANHEKHVNETYGLQPGEYARLYQFQGGRCALCRRATGASKRLAVDHDHATGAVRGLCCGVCNKWILGHARDSIAYFRRCIRYLVTTPYSLMREGEESWVPPGE
jgi:hypothetical protein